MKKVAGFAVVIVAVLLILSQSGFALEGRLLNDGYAVTDSKLAANLSAEPSEEIEKAKSVPLQFSANDCMYKQRDSYYIGEKKKQEIVKTIPLFYNDATSLSMVVGGATLYDSNYETEDTYAGLVLSDGKAFNKNGERADAVSYTFLKLESSFFMNLTKMKIQNDAELYLTPHDIINFSTGRIVYYEPNKKNFKYHYIDMELTDRISVGDQEMPYDEFLILLELYKRTEGGKLVPVEKEKEEDVTTPTPVTAENSTIATEDESAAQADSSASTKHDNNKEKSSGDQDNDGDKKAAGHTPSAASVSMPPKSPDPNRPYNPRPLTDAEKAAKEEEEEDEEPSETPAPTATPAIGYVKPEVSVSDWNSSVYRIESKVVIRDPASRISEKKIRFQIFEGDKLVFRTYQSVTGTMIIGSGMIKPGTTYRVVGEFSYSNEYGELITENFCDKTVTTKDFSTLGSIYLDYTIAGPHSDMIEFSNLKVTSQTDQEALYGIAEFEGIRLSIDGISGEMPFPTNTISTLKRNQIAGYSSSKVLNSCTNYTYKIEAFDYFGNKLTVVNPHTTYTTAKMYPIGTLEVLEDILGSVKTKITIENRDRVNYQNAKVVVKKIDGTVVGTYPLTGEVSELQIDNLEFETKYSFEIYADYDIENGAGMQTEKQIGRKTYTTSSPSELGKLHIISAIEDIKDNSAQVKLQVNKKRTDDKITNNLGSGTLKVIRKDNGVDVTDVEYSLSEEDIHKLKQGEQIVIGDDIVKGLRSMTDYTIQVGLNTRFSTREYPMEVVLSSSEFKTLRKTPEIVIEDMVTTGQFVKFNVKVNDPESAIIGDEIVFKLVTDDGKMMLFGQKIAKNQDNFTTIEVNNLVAGNAYRMNFIATKYNPGYDNTTLENNYLLKSIGLNAESGIEGNIDLQSLDPIERDSTHFKANYKVEIDDIKNELVDDKFYVRVEKDGEIYEEKAYSVRDDQGVLSTIVDKGEMEYKISLYVKLLNQEIVLDSIDFTAEEKIIGIHNAYEYVTFIKAEPNAKYIVLDDIELWTNKTNVSPTGIKFDGNQITGKFTGKLDFQGYSLIYHRTTNGARMFTYVGKRAVIRNVVIEYYDTSETLSNWTGGIFIRNFGTLQSIVLRFKEGSQVGNRNFGVLMYENTLSGIVDRFVVECDLEDKGKPFQCYQYAGLIARHNQGIIRNGCAIGDDISSVVAEDVTDKRIGVLVGVNLTSGRIYNVYSLSHVASAAGSKATTVGAIAGVNQGKVSNVYSVGDNMPTKLAYGPAVGNQETRKDTNAYYISDKVYTNKFNKKVSSESLYDASWHEQVLGEYFNPQDTVPLGYYPQVKLNDCMPEQTWVELPNQSSELPIDVASSKVLEYGKDVGGDYAIVQFRLANSSEATITGINIIGVRTEIDRSSMVTKDGYTTLKARVDNPTRFASEYRMESIQYKTTREHVVEFGTVNERTVLVDFFRYISTAEDWYNYIVLKPNENARLANDIDFSEVPATQISVKDLYEGYFDGNGFTIKNIELYKGSASANNNTLFYGGISAKGKVKNLTVRNYACGGYSMSGNNKNYFSGVALVSKNMGLIENVHILDMEAYGQGNLGGIVAYGQYGSIVDSSVTRAKIVFSETTNGNSTAAVGGICGNMANGIVNNCYVQNVDIQVNDARGCSGVGGLVGYASGTEVNNCYATGRIVARGNNVGGLIGCYYASIDNYSIDALYSNVEIITYGDCAGGAIGKNSIQSFVTNNSDGQVLSFGNIYSYKPDTEYLNCTIGYNASSEVTFYGTETQLVNGIRQETVNSKVCKGLLTKEQMKQQKTYSEIVNLEDIFDTSQVTEGILPKLYRSGSTELLPYQEDNYMNQEVDLSVAGVYINENTKRVTVYLNNPNGLEIEGLDIPYLGLTLQQKDRESLIYTYNEDTTERFYDSYVIEGIRYLDHNNQEQIQTTYTRIGLSLYRTIRTIEDWNNISDEYCENYRIVQDLDFEGRVHKKNVRVGRLLGDNEGQKITISGVNINEASANLMQRVYCGIENIDFKDCSLITSGRDAVGLIGMCNGSIKKVNFENINIQNKSNVAYCGLVGVIQSSSINEVSMKNIVIKSKGSQVGGFCGWIQDTVHMTNVTADTVQVKSENGSYVAGFAANVQTVTAENVHYKDCVVAGVGSYTGGLFGYVGNSIYTNSMLKSVSFTGTMTESEGVKTSTASVTGKGSYIGGLVGCFFGQANGNSQTNPLVKVEGAIVNGSYHYIGGLFGYHHNGPVKNVGIYNSQINAISTSAYSYVGGICGIEYTELTGGVIDQTEINATNHNNVGGVTGYAGNYCRNFCVTNSKLHTTATGSVAVNNVGGVCGNNVSTLYGNRVSNTEVNATKMNHVGGIVGYNSGSVSDCLSYATPETEGYTAGTPEFGVIGENNVGGIIGYQYTGVSRYNASNVYVEARQSAAGGLTGYYRNNNIETLAASGNKIISPSAAYLCKSYFAGKVVAAKNAGGIIGYAGLTSGERNAAEGTGAANESAYTYGNISIAQEVQGGTTQGAFCGNNKALVGVKNRIWEDTIIGNSRVKLVDTDIPYWNAAVERKQSESPTAMRMLKASDLSNYYLYYGLQWSPNTTTTNWHYGLRSTTSGNETYQYYGEDWAKGFSIVNMPMVLNTYNVVAISKSGNYLLPNEESIPLPRAAEENNMSGSSVHDEAVNVVGYANGADTMNLEWNAAMVGNVCYQITCGDEVIAEGVVDRQVYTLRYDYKSKLVIRYGYTPDGNFYADVLNQSQEIKPEELIRLADTKQDTYYYITDKGIVSNEGMWMEGQFRHIYRGQAITMDGQVYNLETKEAVSTVSKCELLTESKPLFNSSYLNYTMQTFGMHTIVQGDGDVYRAAQVFGRNGLHIVDGSMKTVKDGYLFYEKNGTKYEICLGKDGILFSLNGEEVDIAPHFNNKDIVSITNNVEQDSSIVMVVYENGDIVGYNYITGDKIANETKETMSVLGFASELLSKEESSMYARIGGTYQWNEKLSQQIQNTEDIASRVGAEETLSLDQTMEEAALEESEAGTDKGEDTAALIASDEIPSEADSAEAVKKENKSAKLKIQEEDKEEAVVEPEEEKQEKENTKKNQKQTQVASLGDNEFMPMYNERTNGYEIVNKKEYLGSKDYISENSKVLVEGDLAVYGGFAKAETENDNGSRGIVLYILVSLAIIGGVIYIRRRKVD